MRISGGRARSIPIHCPPGDWVRPATDRMREAVFSSLGPRVEGCRFLDLFAGCGSYGLEALSRGGASGVFVEKRREAVTCIRRNLAGVLKSLGEEASCEERFKVFGCDVIQYLGGSGSLPTPECFDLVFVDPPYALYPEVLPNVLVPLRQRLSAGACVVAEVPGDPGVIPEGWLLKRALGKGREDTRVWILMPIQIENSDVLVSSE